MLFQLFFYILIFNSVVFLVLGIKKFLKTLPMMDTFEVEGVLVDARVSKENILKNEDFDVAKEYLYYTYEIDGIKHGSSTLSGVNDVTSRNFFKSIVEKYTKSGEVKIPVFVNKKDSRKSFLVDHKDVKNTPLAISIVSIVTSVIVFLVL